VGNQHASGIRARQPTDLEAQLLDEITAALVQELAGPAAGGRPVGPSRNPGFELVHGKQPVVRDPRQGRGELREGVTQHPCRDMTIRCRERLQADPLHLARAERGVQGGIFVVHAAESRLIVAVENDDKDGRRAPGAALSQEGFELRLGGRGGGAEDGYFEGLAALTEEQVFRQETCGVVPRQGAGIQRSEEGHASVHPFLRLRDVLVRLRFMIRRRATHWRHSHALPFLRVPESRSPR
jgi:hypothetical protein